MWSLPHILPRRPLCWRRHTRSVWFACVCHVRVSMFACVWACVSVSVPVGKWTSLARKPVRGSQGWTLMQPASAHPPPWWLVTPAGVINLQFPLHNQSRRAKVEELHNVKLSETSYKGSFGCCVLSGGDTRTSGRGTRVPLVGTSDLLVSCLVRSQEVQQQFDSANHHTEDRSITRFAEQSEHRGPCSPESAQQVHTAWRLGSEASLSGSKTSTRAAKNNQTSQSPHECFWHCRTPAVF